MIGRVISSIFVILFFTAQCHARDAMTVTSSAFTDGDALPEKYRGDGDNISPPLKWSGIPDGTRSITIICDDPDAPHGTWVHWIVFNIPKTSVGIQEGLPRAGILADGSRQGMNDFRKTGYYGPCPPSGTHRYYYKVYALDTAFKLDSNSDKDDIYRAMEGHVLAKGEVMARCKSIRR